MDFGRATSRMSSFPGQRQSWEKLANSRKELDVKRSGQSWLGKTAEDFASMAKSRLAARQASWIGHREKTAEDYSAEAKNALLRENWIKYIRRMSRRSYGLGKDRPKTPEVLAREQHDKGLQDGWIKWKKRMSVKREYEVNTEIKTKTPEELRQAERERRMQIGWIKWKRRLSAKREYGLGRARSVTEDERERIRIANIQEKGWILPYMCDAQKKEWVRRYRGSLCTFDKEKSAANLTKVDDALEANRIKHLELEWVKNIRKVQMPKFGLGDTKPKTDEELAQDKAWAEVEHQWVNLTTRKMRKETEFGFGPRSSFTAKELSKMATDEELEAGWEEHTRNGRWKEATKLFWEQRNLTLEELELIKIHTEQERNWKSAVTAQTLDDQFPVRAWPWDSKNKTDKQIQEEKRWLKQEREWLRGRSSYNQLQEGFPTVQDLVIQELEKVWALEDMEAEVREERKKLLQKHSENQLVNKEESLKGSDWETIMMYVNDMMEIDFDHGDE